MGQNITIPLELFNELLDVLEAIDLDLYAEDFCDRFTGVLGALQAKRERIEQRYNYAKLIKAKKTGNKSMEHDALIEYLQRRPWPSED